ncbi:MAG: transposase, partial [Terriglobales bacterium]
MRAKIGESSLVSTLRSGSISRVRASPLTAAFYWCARGERLGFGEVAAGCLTETRAKNTQLPIIDLLRQSVYSRLAGYEDMNDAERLAQDPAFRLIGSE